MIRYTLTFLDGNRKTILADRISVTYGASVKDGINTGPSYCFYIEGEVIFTSDFINSIYKEKDCCNSCGNGDECESKNE